MLKRLVAPLAVLLFAFTGNTAATTPMGDIPNEYVADGARAQGLSYDGFRLASEIQAAEEPLVLQVRADPTTYGGVYWDWTVPEPGFVVLYTGSAPAIRYPDVRYVRVERSYSELEAILDDIAATARATDPDSSGFVSVSIDEPSNKVKVVVTQTGASFKDSLDRYANAVTIEIGKPIETAACNSRLDCVPVRGGLRVDGYRSCSYGFNATTSGLVPDAVVIAGHCDFPLHHSWYHNHAQSPSKWIGDSEVNGLHYGKDRDVLRIDTPLPQYSAPMYPYNRIYHSDQSKSIQIRGVVDNSAFYVGMSVRRVGFKSASSGTINGGIMFYVMDVYGGGSKFMWGWPTTTTAIEGDSGGPFYRWNAGSGQYQLVGFTSSTTYGLFASQQDAKDALDISWWGGGFCVNDDCSVYR